MIAFWALPCGFLAASFILRRSRCEGACSVSHKVADQNPQFLESTLENKGSVAVSPFEGMNADTIYLADRSVAPHPQAQDQISPVFKNSIV